MKFTADFSTRNGYGNQICIADTIENLMIALVNRGFNFADGMQNEILSVNELKIDGSKPKVSYKNDKDFKKIIRYFQEIK